MSGITGSVLKDKALREKVFVITKFGNRWGEGIENFKIDGKLCVSMSIDPQAIDVSLSQARQNMQLTPSTLLSNALDSLLMRGSFIVSPKRRECTSSLLVSL